MSYVFLSFNFIYFFFFSSIYSYSQFSLFTILNIVCLFVYLLVFCPSSFSERMHTQSNESLALFASSFDRIVSTFIFHYYCYLSWWSTNFAKWSSACVCVCVCCKVKLYEGLDWEIFSIWQNLFNFHKFLCLPAWLPSTNKLNKKKKIK